MHHFSQLLLLFWSWWNRATLTPTPASLGFTKESVSICACGIDKLIRAVLAVLPACSYVKGVGEKEAPVVSIGSSSNSGVNGCVS